MSINITKFLPTIIHIIANRTARIRRNREAHPSDIPCHESKLYKPCTQAPIYNAPRNDRDSNRKLESPGVHRRDRPLYFRCGKVACWQRRRRTIHRPLLFSPRETDRGFLPKSGEDSFRVNLRVISYGKEAKTHALRSL